MSLSTSIFFHAIGFLLACFPFLVFSSHASPYEFPKFSFFVLMVSVLLIQYVFFVKKPLLKKNLFEKSSLLVMAFIGITYLANLLGLDPITSFLGSEIRRQGFLTLLFSVFFFFLLAIQSEKEQPYLWQIIMRWLAVSTSLLLGFLLFQAFFVYFFHSQSISTYEGRIIGTFGNPNFAAAYFVILLPLFFFWKTNKIQSIWKVYKYSILLLSPLVIVLTLSDSATIALIAESIALVFLSTRPLTRKKQIIIGCVVMGIATIVGIYHMQLMTYIVARISPWDNQFIIWKESVLAFTKQPLLGYGQENVELVFPKEKDWRIDNAHNIFLEIALASGIIGLFLFVLLFITGLKQAPIPIKLGLMGFLLIAQFNPLSLSSIVLLWFLLGVSRYRL